MISRIAYVEKNLDPIQKSPDELLSLRSRLDIACSKYSMSMWRASGWFQQRPYDISVVDGMLLLTVHDLYFDPILADRFLRSEEDLVTIKEARQPNVGLLGSE